MAYRINVREIDRASFVTPPASGNIGMVVDTQRGPYKPIRCNTAADVLLYYGQPTADKPAVLEILEAVKSAPVWVVSAIGANAKQAGVDVRENTVLPFGDRAGRDIETFDYASASATDSQNIGTGDGLTAAYSGTLTETPLTSSSLELQVGGTKVDASESGGTITGDAVSSGSLNTTSGALSVTFAGTVGSVASYKTVEDLTGGIDLSGVASAGYAELSFETPLSGSDVPAITSDTYSLSVAIDGAAASDITFAVTNTEDWTTIVSAIDTALTGASASLNSGKIRITSDSTGSSSTIVIAAGSTGTGGDFITAAESATSENTTLETPVDGINAGIKLVIDESSYDNIDLGAAVSTSRASIITAINTAVGDTVASTNDTGGEFIDIVGLIGSSVFGKVRISEPSTLKSAVTTAIDSSATGTIEEDTDAVDPTGFVPKYNEAVVADYLYPVDLSNAVSHSFFAFSPYNDADYQLKVEIENTSGSQYTLSLYEVTDRGDVLIEEFEYSLLRETDGFGASLYIEDVFRNNPYLSPLINSDYAGAIPSPTVEKVQLTGGQRGNTPTSSDYQTGWNYFLKKSKYPVRTFVDIYGTEASKINTLINTECQYSFGITVTPFANSSSAADAISYREGTGLNTDKIAMYTNWLLTENVYQNSRVWLSGAGKIAANYAQMESFYDALSPAGTPDGDNPGGILSGAKVYETLTDYQESEERDLYAAQVNPIIFDPVLGIVLKGDKTLITKNTDTSFVGTRRLYNLMLDNIIKQILVQQTFKLNDPNNRAKVKTLIDNFLDPIVAENYLREAVVVCDETNNTDVVLNARQFVVDIFVKVTPNSQFVNLNFTRVSQGTVISDILPA